MHFFFLFLFSFHPRSHFSGSSSFSRLIHCLKLFYFLVLDIAQLV